MIRVVDIVVSFLGILALLPILIAITILGFFDTGSPFFIQTRVGRNKEPFRLIKFRTMSVDTESVASHLAEKSAITKFGKFLRRSKIDELPQLLNVLMGSMSIVGPRPNLFNQLEVTEARTNLGIYDVLPGITGLSQINNVDMSTPLLLAKTDLLMIERINLKSYLSMIVKTLSGAGKGDAIK